MLGATLDVEQYHRHTLDEDYSYVTRPDGQREAKPLNAATRQAFLALQQAINRVRVALNLGAPLPLTGVLGPETFQAAHEIAEAKIRIRPQGTHFAFDMLFPLNEMPILASLRTDLNDQTWAQRAFIDLIERARYYASIFNLIADTVWWSTLGGVAPCTQKEVSVSSPKWPILVAASVGLAAGAASVLLILLPRFR